MPDEAQAGKRLVDAQVAISELSQECSQPGILQITLQAMELRDFEQGLPVLDEGPNSSCELVGAQFLELLLPKCSLKMPEVT